MKQMDNSQTLEMKIQATASNANSEVQKLVKSLTTVENVLTNMYLKLGHIEKSGTSSVKMLKSETDKTTNSVNKLGKALSFGGAYIATKKIGTMFMNWMNEAVNYTEQLNLFNVVFKNTEKNGITMYSRLGEEATKFQYKLNEAYGTNKTQSFYMQGIYQSMGETVGINKEYAVIMSENMTKLTYDLASLYNKSENVTAEALRAGVYAG